MNLCEVGIPCLEDRIPSQKRCARAKGDVLSSCHCQMVNRALVGAAEGPSTAARWTAMVVVRGRGVSAALPCELVYGNTARRERRGHAKKGPFENLPARGRKFSKQVAGLITSE